MKIREIAEYYVERYQLDTDYTSNSSEYINDGLGTYNTAISRILKNKEIADKSLWDVIKQQKKPREISLDDFIMYCFPQWSEYIINNHGDSLSEKAKRNLKEDHEYYDKITNDKYYEEKAELIIESINETIRNYNPMQDEFMDDIYTSYSENCKEVRMKGMEMQIEAIFEMFYEPFNWKLLAEDMTEIANAPNNYNPEITPDIVKADENLSKGYKSYTKQISK